MRERNSYSLKEKLREGEREERAKISGSFVRTLFRSLTEMKETLRTLLSLLSPFVLNNSDLKLLFLLFRESERLPFNHDFFVEIRETFSKRENRERERVGEQRFFGE